MPAAYFVTYISGPAPYTVMGPEGVISRHKEKEEADAKAARLNARASYSPSTRNTVDKLKQNVVNQRNAPKRYDTDR